MKRTRTKWTRMDEGAREWVDHARDGELEVLGLEGLATTAADLAGASAAYPFARAAMVTRFQRLLKAAHRIGATKADGGGR